MTMRAGEGPPSGHASVRSHGTKGLGLRASRQLLRRGDGRTVRVSLTLTLTSVSASDAAPLQRLPLPDYPDGSGPGSTGSASGADTDADPPADPPRKSSAGTPSPAMKPPRTANPGRCAPKVPLAKGGRSPFPGTPKNWPPHFPERPVTELAPFSGRPVIELVLADAVSPVKFPPTWRNLLVRSQDQVRSGKVLEAHRTHRKGRSLPPTGSCPVRCAR